MKVFILTTFNGMDAPYIKETKQKEYIVYRKDRTFESISKLIQNIDFNGSWTGFGKTKANYESAIHFLQENIEILEEDKRGPEDEEMIMRTKSYIQWLEKDYQRMKEIYKNFDDLQYEYEF